MQKETGSAARGPGFAETVALIAMLMGLTALGIDTMLPALPQIGENYGIADPNHLQLIVYVYMAGFALAQLVYGPLADIYGRRPVQLVGLAILIAGASYAAVAPSFDQLMVARFIQGVGAASARVLAISIVRDRYEGREMARVMSFIMMIFIIIPVLAPSFGGFLLLFAGWRWIFTTMAVLSFLTAWWFYGRMPETLHPEYRRHFNMREIAEAAVLCVTNRTAFGYATGLGLMFGTLMGYIGSSEQILGSDVYRLGDLFPLAFASVALAGGISAFVNSLLVRRWGMRRLSHGSHIAHILLAGTLLLVSSAYEGVPPLALFMLLMILMQFFFVNFTSNFNAMALEPLGAVAGTASSLIGCYTTLLGTVIGSYIGQSFDGTVMPLAEGYFFVSAFTMGVVLWTERGRLFHATHDHEALPASAE